MAVNAAVANAVTPANMLGLYKESYADGIEGLIPEVAYLYKNVKFGEAQRVGNLYHQPVILTRENGITYAGASEGAYALAPASPMVMKDAQLQGSQTTLRSQIAYNTVARSMNSAKAFRKATLPIFESNMESHSMRLELAMIYGQSATGIGQSSAGTAVDATHYTMTFSDATWAVGVWAGSEGAKCIAYFGSDSTLVGDASSEDNAVYTVYSVDPDNKKVTFSGTSTGITELTTAGSAAALNWYFYGTTGLTATHGGAGIVTTWATTASVEMAGLDRIITNAATLFAVSASQYTLWKGNSYAAGGQLTMGKVMSAVTKAVGKGGLKEKVVCLTSIETWPNLMIDQAALRKYDGSYKSGEFVNGAETVKFFGANGEIEIRPHCCIKGGEAFIVPLKRFVRVGANEITFNTPGRGEEIFLQLPDNNGFEVRSYADQALLPTAPAKCTKVTGIVNVAA